MLVLSDREKYNIVQHTLKSLVQLLKRVSSEKFYSHMAKLDEVVAELVPSWSESGAV